ncbi:MAG: hypothetical protein AVDCRST_MAG52-3604 [uncultured Blastococcus sp.]|uniref:DUF4878 domain-containing protein n=1 Tax=uncultured Blastococcus sp. TaxID=217144 RepID=A0A6J4JG48_9ACTN|nr:MAG: hypothetical protein AVDCRST_MAG52-3604 [uncultured Blastococcus sp.]
MSTGPYLYDDEPEPLHTSTPRTRNGQLIAVLVATALVAVGTVVGLFLVRGSPAEQSEEAVQVFLAALAADDTETAHQLLCETESARIDQDEVAGAYLGTTPGEVVGSTDAGIEQVVEVRWADAATSRFAVISEDGARICGLVEE